MKQKDTTKVNTLRSLLAAFTNELVAEKKAPDSTVPDELALRVIKRAVKQHKDSIAQFSAGGRADLVAQEEKELTYIEPLLPKGAGEDDIRRIAETKKTELGISDAGKVGILVGAVIKELGGNADGAEVKKIVESLF